MKSIDSENHVSQNVYFVYFIIVLAQLESPFEADWLDRPSFLRVLFREYGTCCVGSWPEC